MRKLQCFFKNKIILHDNHIFLLLEQIKNKSNTKIWITFRICFIGDIKTLQLWKKCVQWSYLIVLQLKQIH